MSLLALEPLLLARLRARLPAAVQVLAAPSLADVSAQSQPPAAVYLVYRGGVALDCALLHPGYSRPHRGGDAAPTGAALGAEPK